MGEHLGGRVSPLQSIFYKRLGNTDFLIYKCHNSVVIQLCSTRAVELDVSYVERMLLINYSKTIKFGTSKVQRRLKGALPSYIQSALSCMYMIEH